MRRLGCRVAAAGLLSALPRLSSCSFLPIPMPSSKPHLHPRGCSWEYLLGLGCQGCSRACSTPFSRLLQPSVRSVVDLEVMTFGRHPLPYPSPCARVTLAVGVHSVCAPVNKSGGLAGLLQSPGCVHSSDGSSTSRPFLRFLLCDTVYQFQVLWPLHGSAGHHLGHGSCFSYTPFSGYLYASIPRHLAGPVFSRESLLEVLLPVLRLCLVFGIVIPPRYSNLIPSQVVQCLWVVFDSTSFGASPSVERISRRQSATAVFMSCA